MAGSQCSYYMFQAVILLTNGWWLAITHLVPDAGFNDYLKTNPQSGLLTALGELLY